MKRNTGINIVIVLFSIAFIFLVYSSIQEYFLKRDGVRVEGAVTYIESVRYPNRFIYKTNTPIVTYMTKDGVFFTTRSCDSCNKIGERVSVIYDPKNPKYAIVDTRSVDIEVIYYLILFPLIALFYLRLKKNIKNQ